MDFGFSGGVGRGGGCGLVLAEPGSKLSSGFSFSKFKIDRRGNLEIILNVEDSRAEGVLFWLSGVSVSVGLFIIRAENANYVKSG